MEVTELNRTIENILEMEQPLIKCFTAVDKIAYKQGLGLLGIFLDENFLDIPRLKMDRDNLADGLYYSLPYYDDSSVYSSGSEKTILVVTHLDHGSSWCPLRIESIVVDKEHFKLTVKLQDKIRLRSPLLFERDGDEMYTSYDKLEIIRLSTLMADVDESIFTGSG
jgi:hypothetical protein